MAPRGGMAAARSGHSAYGPAVPCSRVRRRVGGGADGCAHLLAQQRVGGGVDEGAHLLARRRVGDGCCSNLACSRMGRRLLVQFALPVGLCSPAAWHVGLRCALALDGGSGRGGAAALTSLGSRRGRAADPLACAARRHDEGRERRGEGTIVNPSSFCRARASAAIVVDAAMLHRRVG